MSRVFDRSQPLASDLLSGRKDRDVARSSVKVGPTPHQCRSDEDSSCSSAFISVLWDDSTCKGQTVNPIDQLTLPSLSWFSSLELKSDHSPFRWFACRQWAQETNALAEPEYWARRKQFPSLMPWKVALSVLVAEDKGGGLARRVNFHFFLRLQDLT